ncbi:MAG: XapX domain-containing protein [Polyangiaceae bacterium]
MIVKSLIGIVVGVGIGVGCRWFGIPLPGPPAIFGAVLAVAMATGYTLTDWLMTSARAGAAPSPAAASDRP